MADTRRKRKWDVDNTGNEVATPPCSSSDSIHDMLSTVKQSVSASSVSTGTVVRLTEETSAIKNVETKTDGKLQYTGDIDINDIRNRYLLTKGATQIDIKERTGADVITRGKYYPDRNLATEKEPPLYLHIVAQTEESLDEAIAIVKELLEQSLVLIQARERPPPRERPPRQFFQDKVYVEVETERGFNVRAKIVGPAGAYVKHIQNTTGARIQLKGQGSGYVETETGREADEQLHVHISSPHEEEVMKAKELVQDLINTVKADYVKWKNNKPAPRPTLQSISPPPYGAVPPPMGMGYPAMNAASVNPSVTAYSGMVGQPSPAAASVPTGVGAPAALRADSSQDQYLTYYNYYQYIISQSDPATASYYSAYLQQLMATNPALAAAAKLPGAIKPQSTTASPSFSQPQSESGSLSETSSAPAEPVAKKVKTDNDFHNVPPPASMNGSGNSNGSIESFPESATTSATTLSTNSPTPRGMRKTASDFFDGVNDC